MLVAGSIPEGMVVCHACDTPSCVRPVHLFLGTQGDNVRDARDKGRLVAPRGEHNGQARLTVDDVRMIYTDLAAGMRQHAVADRYGISTALVSMIAHGQRWGHVRKGAETK